MPLLRQLLSFSLLLPALGVLIQGEPENSASSLNLDIHPYIVETGIRCREAYMWEQVGWGRIPTFEELDAGDNLELASRMKDTPQLSHNMFDMFYVFKVLDSIDFFSSDKTALGFGVAEGDVMAPYLASRGVTVTALEGALDTIPVSLQAVNSRQIASSETMDAKVTLKKSIDMINLKETDMYKTSRDKNGQYDLIWTFGSVHKLGSIRKGLEFIVSSLDLIKNGGIGFFTTEVNLNSIHDTRDNAESVIFRKKDLDVLYECVMKKGYTLSAPYACFSVGIEPPREELYWKDDGFTVTSFATSILKGSHFVRGDYDCKALFDDHFS